MIEERTEGRREPRTVALTGNEPRVLGGEPTLCVVQSGSVAVFCAEVRDGAPAGPRRLLFRIGSGQAVCSVPAEAAGGLSFMIVPIEEAILEELPLAELWFEHPDRRRLVDEWVELVARYAGGAAVPKLVRRTAGDGALTLDEGQALAAERGRVVWTRVEEGEAYALGDGQLVLREGDALPLAEGLWLEVHAPVRLQALASGDVEDDGLVRASLTALHRRALTQLAEETRAREAAELARLRQRDELQARREREAMVELASVLGPEPQPGPRETPLLTALSLVGATMGVEIRAAGKSEDSGRGEELEAIARASRIRTRRVGLHGRWWKRDCGSLLGFSADEERRPLALVRTKRLRYTIHDPVDGTVVPLDARSAARIGTEGVMLYRPLPEGGLNLLDLFRFSISGRKRELMLAVLTGLCATLLGMVTPQATALLMDHAIPDADDRLLMEIGGGLLAAAFGMTIFQLSQGIVLMRIGIGSEAESQAALWDRLLRLRPSFFRGFSSGDLQSRVMAVNEVGRELSGATLTTLFSSFLALLNLLLLYYYSPQLTLLAVAVGAVVMLFTTSIGMLIRNKFRILMELEGRLFGVVVQLINGVGKLRVAGAADRAYLHWVRQYGDQLRLRSQSDLLYDGLLTFNTVVPPFSAIFLYYLAFPMLGTEGQSEGASGLSLGMFLAFNAAYGTFLGGITSIGNTVVGLMDTAAKGRRVKPLLQAEPEIDETKADPGRLTGRLSVSGVEFRYDPEGPKILDGVSFRAEPGEFIALVGPSGSGKSTLLRLLLGFETPASGTIAYDGQDLANLDVLAIRRQLGVVLQAGRLDSGSIFENIACGNVLALDEAWAAAEDAGFADEVRSMPMGMHTIVSVGGGNLSGGQRQRLLIARALAQRPRLLLFDEATSALDNRTQAIVSQSLERLNVTRIVIAHRLSTIRNADRIYVLESGRMVQQGRFSELMSDDDGLFARMMRRQLA